MLGPPFGPGQRNSELKLRADAVDLFAPTFRVSDGRIAAAKDPLPFGCGLPLQLRAKPLRFPRVEQQHALDGSR